MTVFEYIPIALDNLCDIQAFQSAFVLLLVIFAFQLVHRLLYA